jgi:hypothetical protein
VEVRALAALVLLAAVLAGGCGTSAGRPVTKAQFISQADAICAAGNAQMRPLRGRLRNLDEGSVQAIREAVDIQQSGAKRMRALGEPPGDSRTLHVMLAFYERADQAGLALANALERRDTQHEAQDIRANNEAHTHAQALARSYGFRVCGFGGR